MAMKKTIASHFNNRKYGGKPVTKEGIVEMQRLTKEYIDNGGKITYCKIGQSGIR